MAREICLSLKALTLAAVLVYYFVSARRSTIFRSSADFLRRLLPSADFD